jgi:alpha-galactosidase
MIRMGEKWDIRLVDTSDENLDVSDRLVRRMVEQAGASVKVSAATDRRQLLPGAEVVVSTIGVGGRRAWEADVLVPREFGIFQPVGDSVMPGGVSRALRQVPVLVAVAEDIAELCPGAWFFNYANPMSANCRAILKSTPVKVVGLCHGVNDVEGSLARFAGLDRKDVRGDRRRRQSPHLVH